MPITSQREPGPIVTLPMFASALPFGSASERRRRQFRAVDVVQVDAAVLGRGRQAFLQVRRAHHALEFAQTVDGGAPFDEGRVTVDEPRERIADGAERGRDLHQHAERERTREIARRGDDEREDDRDLPVEAQHEREPLRVLHHAPPVVADAHEEVLRVAGLGLLAVVERDLLGVLAHADQPEAEVGLDALLLVVDRHERMADLLDDQRADHRVQRRRPHHVAGNRDRRRAERNRQRAGERPQDRDERHERDDRRQQVERQRERGRRERLEVVGDPLVGVVGEAVTLDPVERAIAEPLAESGR